MTIAKNTTATLLSWQNKQSYALSYLAPNGWKAIIACLHLKKCHLKLAEEALLQQQNSYMAHFWLETLKLNAGKHVNTPLKGLKGIKLDNRHGP